MSIVDHKLVWADWVPTQHRYRTIKPSLIVIHESGTSIGKGNCVRYCKRNKRKVAYHIVIERDGTVVQMAEFNRKTNHAGKSSWKNKKYSANGYAIGVALVGPTELKGTEQSATAYYGRTFTAKDGISKGASKYHGSKHIWLKHTDAQLKSLDKVVMDIRAAYPGIDIAGHYHVSPGRKIDPSPLVNIDRIGYNDLMEVQPKEEEDVFLGEKPAVKGKDVAKFKRTSRKMRFTDKAKKVVVAIGSGGFLSWNTMTQVKQFVNDNAGFMILGAAAIAFLVFKYFEVKSEEDYVEGRYEPSEYEGRENVE